MDFEYRSPQAGVSWQLRNTININNKNYEKEVEQTLNVNISDRDFPYFESNNKPKLL